MKERGMTHLEGGSTVGPASRPWHGVAARTKAAMNWAGLDRKEGKTPVEILRPPLCNDIIY